MQVLKGYAEVPDTGSACVFLAELSEMNVNEDGTIGKRRKSK